MIEDFKKSAKSIIQDRMTSPFWGTLLFSWSIWNWKILYLTFIVNQNKITGTKIDFIVTNYSAISNIIILPLISTLTLLTIVPFISNGAFWLSLRFQKWRLDQKYLIERTQLLTLQDSIQLREEIINQEKKFERFLEDKNLEIEQLKSTINFIQSQTKNDKNPPPTSYNDDSNELSEKIYSNEKLKQAFDTLIKHIQGNWEITPEEIDFKTLGFFIGSELIQNKGGRTYAFTDKGNRVLKLITLKNF